MGKSDRTGKKEAIRTAEKSKNTGKIALLSAGKQATAKTDSKEKINGQRTMRKVEQKMKKTMRGRLNSYLTDIEEQAQERFEGIVEQMKQAQGITEQLKAENALQWVGRMNNIQACAREIVDKEIVYQ